MKFGVIFICSIAGAGCFAHLAFGATPTNLARWGTPMLGAGANLTGSDDVTVAHFGPVGEINDGVANSNFAANGFTIDGNGQMGANGNGADTFAGEITTNLFDFVGVLFSELQFGVASVRVQNFLANDGGWWGANGVVAGGVPLTAADLTAPQVQVTTDGGASWAIVAGVTSDYVSQYTGVVRGTGFPNATSGPFATFNFTPQNGINGIRLIGSGGGPADGNGFIGVNEFEAIGVAQNLTLEVNTTVGRVRLINEVQSSISLNFYQITSSKGSLDVAGWNSLENPSGNPAGFPSGDGSGNGWEEFGNLNEKIVAEAFLQGVSTLAPGESLSLGNLFAGGDQDLALRYRTSTGRFVDVPAVYVTGLPGDFDGDHDADGRDFLAWQRELGSTLDATDFGDWAEYFGTSPSTTVVINVPEPGTHGLLVGLAVSGAAFLRAADSAHLCCVPGPRAVDTWPWIPLSTNT
jgi:hypothetical protein